MAHVGLPGFIVDTAENVRAMENAVNLANVSLLTARAIGVLTVAGGNTAVRVTVQIAVVQAVTAERTVQEMLTVRDPRPVI